MNYQNIKNVALIALIGTLFLTLTACPGLFGPRIHVGSVTIGVGQTGSIFISASLLPAGLLGIEVSGTSKDFLTYDPDVLEVTDVIGVAGFTVLAFNADNTKGQLSFVATKDPTGPISNTGGIVEVVFKHAGGNKTKSTIKMKITNLVDENGLAITGIPVGMGQVKID